MISYTPAVVFGLLRGELVMMRSQQSNLNLVLIKIVETISIMDVKRNFLKCAFLENDFIMSSSCELNISGYQN